MTLMMTTSSNLSAPRQIIILTVFINFVSCFVPFASRCDGTGIQCSNNRRIGDNNNTPSSHIRLYAGAADLSTAYEWLAENRSEVEGLVPLKWIKIDDEEEDEGMMTPPPQKNSPLKDRLPRRMPLYPLNACYMPTNSTTDLHTLYNVEPQNIQMAQDLINEKRRFCTVLRAVDTGRISSVGTVMRIVEYDEQRLWNGTLARIVLKCVPEERVKVCRIENGAAWSRERRLRRNAEYLLAQVETFECDDDDMNKNKTDEESVMNMFVSLLNNAYAAVRDKYMEEGGEQVAANYPPFAVDGLKSLPTELLLLPNNKNDEDKSTTYNQSFWSAAETWQRFCQTIKEANRVNIQSEVNEITIQTAMAQGGALNLPVHREDLPFGVRIRLNKMEEDAALEFVKIGLDPVTDFQYLLDMRGLEERMKYLHRMIAREQDRLVSLKSKVMT